ncbi:MAG TPA: amino acid-binding protein [Clostridiales bacterium]|jgi:hypothetical protein|nr:amino acid-binding protein [Clostridiales bacterium]HCG35667.1 amino acid-binding protein [Clostridiales bacterium]
MNMQQISVFLENKPGRLSSALSLLSQSHINIRALSIAETPDYGVLRMIVDKPDEALFAFQKAGFAVSFNDVLALSIPDRPGGLSEAVSLLVKHGIDVDYIYAFVGNEKEEAYVVFRTEKNEQATLVLKKAGYKSIE